MPKFGTYALIDAAGVSDLTKVEFVVKDSHTGTATKRINLAQVEDLVGGGQQIVEKLTISGGTITSINAGTAASGSVLNTSQGWNVAGTRFVGWRLNVTDTNSATSSSLLELAVGSISRFDVSKGGAVTAAGDIKSGANVCANASTANLLGFTDGTAFYYDGSNCIGQRAGTAAQKLSIYNARASSNDWERLALDWRTTANEARVGTEKSGAGVARDLVLITDGTVRLRLDSTGPVTINEAYTLPTTDGANGQVLATNGAGTVSWTAAAGGGTTSIYATMNRTGHGLTNTALGKPVFVYGILDDTDATEFPTGVVAEIVNANEFKYAKSGDTLNIAAALIAGNYVIATDTRFLYWDASNNNGNGKYVTEKPVDSDPTLGPILLVNSYANATQTYNVTVLATGVLP